MKEIILSLKPNWIEEIINNNKILELRKSYPNCELPLKAYIYCTKSGNKLILNNKSCNGFIIGELIIKRIYKINIINSDLYVNDKEQEWEKLENYSKVKKPDIIKYFNDVGYGWQITQFKIYDNYNLVEHYLGNNYNKQLLRSWCFIN